MGALCGKESGADNNFAGAGRPLGAAPPHGATSAPLPANKRVGGPPRTLGGGGGGPSSSSAGVDASEARRRAAEAAEVIQKFLTLCVSH